MRQILFFALFTLLLTACGQTGPLYLPGHQPDGKATPKTVAPVPKGDQPVSPEAGQADQPDAGTPAPVQEGR